MSITDELREWANEHLHKSGIRSDLLTIADRIDAEHERVMSRAGQLLADAEHDRNCYYLNWQDCKQKVLQGNITFNELNARIECLEDELSNCIELPKDADGVPIRVGDVLTDGECRFKVFELAVFKDGSWRIHNVNGNSWDACDVTHYHKPTVEDVLDGFASAYDLIDGDDEGHHEYLDLIAEYAAKLCLADEKE